MYTVVLDCIMNNPECIECHGEGPTDCLRCGDGYFLDSGTCLGMQQTSYIIESISNIFKARDNFVQVDNFTTQMIVSSRVMFTQRVELNLRSGGKGNSKRMIRPPNSAQFRKGGGCMGSKDLTKGGGVQ